MAVTGVLVSEKALKTAKMQAKDVYNAWNSAYPVGAILASLGEQFVIGVKGFGSDDDFGNDWNHLKSPNMRFYTVIGSHAYRYGLSYLPGDMNTIKSNLLRGNDPVALRKFTPQLNKVVAKGTDLKTLESAVTFLLTRIQRVSILPFLSSPPLLAHLTHLHCLGSTGLWHGRILQRRFPGSLLR